MATRATKKKTKKKSTVKKLAKKIARKTAQKTAKKSAKKTGKKSSLKKTSRQNSAKKSGPIAWTELQSERPEQAFQFYGELLGWKSKTERLDSGDDYIILKHKGSEFGGMMRTKDPKQNSHWLTYFSVGDLEKVTREARAMGARVLMEPHKVDSGKLSVLQDPYGAVFALFRPH